MPTPRKLELIEEIKAKFNDAQSLIFTDFKGLSVEQISQFRIKLREHDAEYRIYKNTLTKIAISDNDYSSDVNEHLVGTTAVVIGKTDPIAPLKVLKDFEKTKKIPLKVGVIDGQAFGIDDLMRLRELPGPDQLRGMLLGVIKAPIKNFVTLMSAPTRDLLGVLTAKAAKEEEK